MSKLSNAQLQQIIDLAAQSNASKISGINGRYIEGGELVEHYEYARFDKIEDALYAVKILTVGAEIVKELLELREQVRRRPIESAPKDGTHILAMGNIGVIKEAWWKQNIMGEWGWGGDGWNYPEWKLPTHWQPLPPATKGGNDECYLCPFRQLHAADQRP